MPGVKWDTSKLVKNLAKGYKFVPHLDRAIEGEERPWEFKFKPKTGDDAWHPSGDCTPSLLKLYEKAVGPPQSKKLSASTAKTYMVGHFWHQWLQFLTVEIGLADQSAIEVKGQKGWGRRIRRFEGATFCFWEGENPNFKWQPYHWVTGSADICPLQLPKHGEYVVDFKTMNASHFKLNGLPEAFADKYECQINIYMDLFDMDRAMIVAVQKENPHELKEFLFERNQPLIDAIYEKWHRVSEYLEALTPPEPNEDVPLPLAGVVG